MELFTLIFILYWSFFFYHRILIGQIIKKYNVKTRYTFLGGGIGRQPKRYSNHYFVNGRSVYFSNEVFTTKLRYTSDNKEVNLNDIVLLQNYTNNLSTDTYNMKTNIYAKADDACSPYHVGNCKYGSMIKHKIYFKSYEEAKASGRRPCSYCNHTNTKF